MGPDRLAAYLCHPHDPAFGRVVDGDLEVYSIAGNESDGPAPSHPAGFSGVHLTVVGKPDSETGVAQGLDHGPLGSRGPLRSWPPSHLKAVSHPHIMGRGQTGY